MVATLARNTCGMVAIAGVAAIGGFAIIRLCASIPMAGPICLLLTLSLPVAAGIFGAFVLSGRPGHDLGFSVLGVAGGTVALWVYEYESTKYTQDRWEPESFGYLPWILVIYVLLVVVGHAVGWALRERRVEQRSE